MEVFNLLWLAVESKRTWATSDALVGFLGIWTTYWFLPQWQLPRNSLPELELILFRSEDLRRSGTD